MAASRSTSWVVNPRCLPLRWPSAAHTVELLGQPFACRKNIDACLFRPGFIFNVRQTIAVVASPNIHRHLPAMMQCQRGTLLASCSKIFSKCRYYRCPLRRPKTFYQTVTPRRTKGTQKFIRHSNSASFAWGQQLYVAQGDPRLADYD